MIMLTLSMMMLYNPSRWCFRSFPWSLCLESSAHTCCLELPFIIQEIKEDFIPAVPKLFGTRTGFLLWLFITKSCSPCYNCMDCRSSGILVLHYLLEFAQTHVYCVSDAIQQYQPLWPLCLLPSIFPSIRVFCNELALHIRCPKYWSFIFSISPSNEYSGLTSLRIDLFDLAKSSQVFSNTTIQKHQFFCVLPSLWSNSHIHT